MGMSIRTILIYIRIYIHRSCTHVRECMYVYAYVIDNMYAYNPCTHAYIHIHACIYPCTYIYVYTCAHRSKTRKWIEGNVQRLLKLKKELLAKLKKYQVGGSFTHGQSKTGIYECMNALHIYVRVRAFVIAYCEIKILISLDLNIYLYTCMHVRIYR